MIQRLAFALARLIPSPAKRWIDRHPRVRGALSGAYARVRRGGPTPVAVRTGPLAGMTLVVDDTTPAYYWVGDGYEPEVAALLTRAARPGAVVADVGANIGYFTLLLARAVGDSGRVLAFEPDPAAHDRLAANVRSNGLAHVDTLRLAASDTNGELTFASARASQYGRVLDDSEPARGDGINEESEREIDTAVRTRTTASIVRVPAARLDDLIAERGWPDPMLMKIDVEDHEAAVLRGAADLIARARPVLLIEIHSAASLAGCVTCLAPLGYDITPLPDDATLAARIDAARRGEPSDETDFSRGYILCRAPA